MRVLGAALLGLAVAGCSTTQVDTRKPMTSKPVVQTQARAAPTSLKGHNADSLIRFFGKPTLDVQEMQGRKLQFINNKCVVDAYLYPDKGRTPVVTHVDTRNRDGESVDADDCIASFAKQ